MCLVRGSRFGLFSRQVLGAKQRKQRTRRIVTPPEGSTSVKFQVRLKYSPRELCYCVLIHLDGMLANLHEGVHTGIHCRLGASGLTGARVLDPRQ